jgi:uncharacterized membrane protein YfcA
MHTVLYLLLGLLVGCLSGLLGIGGGMFLLPLLVEVGGLDPRKAAGMTLAVLAIPVTLPGVRQYFAQGHLTGHDLRDVLTIAVAFAVGAFAGAGVQQYVSLTTLRFAFGLVLIYVAVRYILGCDREAWNAAAGLVAVAIAWLGFIGLRMLGRKHRARPNLDEEIRRSEQGDGWDYQI